MYIQFLAIDHFQGGKLSAPLSSIREIVNQDQPTKITQRKIKF